MQLSALQRGMLRRIASSRTELWRTIGLLAAAGLFAVCIGALIMARSDANERARTLAANTAALLSYDIAHMMQRFDHVLETTSARLQTPALPQLDETARSLVLFGPAGELRQLGFINVLDENGQVIESPKPSELGSRWASRDYFRAQSLNPSLGLYVSAPFGEGEYASVALSRRWTHDDGTFAGVVVAGLRLNYLRELFANADVGARGAITLLRGDGIVLMRWPFDRNAIGREEAPDQPARDASQHFVATHIDNLPLSLRVDVARDDVANTEQARSLAVLVAGAIVACAGLALTAVLQREIWRRETAERNNRQKTEYLVMTSHELHTPLQSILGNAERLRIDPMLDPANARRLLAIVSAGTYLRAVVDRVLNYLHVATRLPTPRVRRVVLEELLDQCCIMVESDTAAKGLGLRYGFKAGAPEEFMTDEDLLRQILVNLLSNAVKFTEHGEVAIEVGGTPERITIEVKDTGCGIPPAQRCKLFKDGERLGAERKGIPGHGIGLAMSRRLVQALGGDIGFRENPDTGSIFWVGLPAGAPLDIMTVDLAVPSPALPALRFSDMEQLVLDLARKVDMLLDELNSGVNAPATDMVRDVARLADTLGFAELAAAARDFGLARVERSPALADAAQALATAASDALAELREPSSAGVVGPQ